MSRKPHIAVIDPAVRIPELDSYNHIVQMSSLPTSYHLPAMFGIESLLDAGRPAAIIVMGSGASVHDNLPWQQELNEWLKPLIEQGIPTLGLCYGHQLIAHLFGGKVGYIFQDLTKLKGFRRVTVQPSRFLPKVEEGLLVVSHRETVTDCPPGFTIGANSSEIPIDGLSHAQLPIWSFQTHPESTHAFVKHGEIPWSGDESMFHFGHRLVKAFLDHVALHKSLK